MQNVSLSYLISGGIYFVISLWHFLFTISQVGYSSKVARNSTLNLNVLLLASLVGGGLLLTIGAFFNNVLMGFSCIVGVAILVFQNLTGTRTQFENRQASFGMAFINLLGSALTWVPYLLVGFTVF